MSSAPLRVSLTVGIGAVALGGTLGTVIGLAAGYAGRWTETVLMRAVDILMSFPGRGRLTTDSHVGQYDPRRCASLTERALTVVSFNLIGDALRDALDPRTR
jgi:ABC-type dipeptide/oligopeptide/nickel transport system permease subunit